MCELFALSARTPTTVSLSLETFAERGGRTGPHADGWGIAYYDGPDAMIIRDTRPAATSAWVPFVSEKAPRSTTVMSHIRKATQGKVHLANTQPFRRELAGRAHVFVHNGDLDGLDIAETARFQPIGETDSERAFCNLMARMEAIWAGHRTVPPLMQRAAVFSAFCEDMRDRGPANFLYSDGTSLFAHANKRTQADGDMRPPGLHVLCRTCAVDSEALNSDGITVGSGGQSVLLFASTPLSDEPWQAFDDGQIVIAENGRLVSP